ncbi:MAG: GNAT family N-acetyltransferase [Pseudohongiellaceae bacterium]|nr:GNAT family N-acetyltransferase [Pseudohongiellaceae bacterium]
MERRNCPIGEHTFQIGNITAEDSASVLELFSAAFGDQADERWFHWKQCDAHTKAVGLWSANGDLVAYYSGIPRTMLLQGQQYKAAQIGDVMVAPKLRGILSRKGPFYHVCSSFLQSLVGENKTFSFAFGFPNDRAMALGELLGFYRRTVEILQLTWSTKTARLMNGWRCQQLNTRHKGFAKIAKSLWQAMRRDQGDYVLGERDPAYLQWRFIDRPDKEYFFFCVRRWWGRPAALIVLTRNGENVELVDIIAKRRFMPIAVEAARVEARRVGCDTLHAWASPVVSELIGAEANKAPSGATMPIDNMSPLSDKLHSEQWWWLGGDTDFR